MTLDLAAFGLKTVHRTMLTLNGQHPLTRILLTDVDLRHKLVMTGFAYALDNGAPEVRASHGVLHAVQTDSLTVKIITQALIQPDFSQIAEEPWCLGGEPKPYTAPLNYRAGTRLRFQIDANPVHSPNPGPDRRGKIAPVLGTGNQLAWLTRRGERHGFTVQQATADRPKVWRSESLSPPVRERDHPGNRFALHVVRFTGTLTVTDPAAFATAVLAGIGPGKSYGCGLLLLAPTSPEPRGAGRGVDA